MAPPQLRRIALVATNQVDLGIRALSGALLDAGCETRMFFLEHPGECYPDEVIEEFLALIGDVDLVGISTLAYSYRRTQQLLAVLRAAGKPAVLGGLHCTFRPEEAIADAEIVCLGEGEEIIVDLVRNWSNRFDVPGLWLRADDGSVVRNARRPLLQDLDALPMPDYSAERVHLLEDGHIVKDSGRVKPTHHHQIGDRTTFVYASDRGCPLACTFCYNHQMRVLYPGQRPLRFKSVDRVLCELRQVVANYPEARFINFMNDDSFARSRGDIREFASRYRDEIGIPFFMMGNPHTITYDSLEVLVDAGLQVLNMGIQSGSDHILKEVYERPCPINKVLRTAELIHGFTDRLTVYYDLIINSPFESEDELMQTIDLVRRLPPPFYLVTHNLVVGDDSHLWRLGAARSLWDDSEAHRIYHSDFHDFANFGSRGHVTPYLNHVLEWMAGRHDGEHRGCLPRRIASDTVGHPVTRFVEQGGVLPESALGRDLLQVLVSPTIRKFAAAEPSAIVSLSARLPTKTYWDTPAYATLRDAGADSCGGDPGPISR